MGALAYEKHTKNLLIICDIGSIINLEFNLIHIMYLLLFDCVSRKDGSSSPEILETLKIKLATLEIS